MKLVNEAFVYAFKEVRLATTVGSDLEHNKYVGQLTTIVRLTNCKDEALLSCLDKTNENNIDKTSSKQTLINNHDIDANKDYNKRQLSTEHNFGICERLEKFIKILDVTNHSKQLIYRILFTQY